MVFKSHQSNSTTNYINLQVGEKEQRDFMKFKYGQENTRIPIPEKKEKLLEFDFSLFHFFLLKF